MNEDRPYKQKPVSQFANLYVIGEMAKVMAGKPFRFSDRTPSAYAIHPCGALVRLNKDHRPAKERKAARRLEREQKEVR